MRAGANAAIESFGPVLPSLLELAYALVYALGPFCLAVLYLSGHRKRAGRFLFVFVASVLLCYAQLPFWPSDPPRTVFPGEDAPSYQTVFRRLNWWMLAGGGIHTGVFPSAHVAGAFGAAFGMREAMLRRPRIYRGLLAVAALIAVATVYGRYHYLADAVAGFLVAGATLAFSRFCGPEPSGSAEVRRLTVGECRIGETLPGLSQPNPLI